MLAELLTRESALIAAATLASAGALIATFEWLAIRGELGPAGLFSWSIARLRPSIVVHLLDRLLRERPFRAVLVVRAGSLVLCPIAIVTGRHPAAVLGVVVITTLLVNVRAPYGMDGSDQMATHIFGALWLGYLAGTPLALDAALWYIALQSALSYFTAGVAKLFSPQWREGKTVFGIFNTRSYGHEPTARFLAAHDRLTKALSWGAIAAETTFAVALVTGVPGALVFVVWGVAFHTINAVVMGLNAFLWSFIAAYPAVIYCAAMLAATRAG